MKAVIAVFICMLSLQLSFGQQFGDTVCLGMKRTYHVPGGAVYSWNVTKGTAISPQGRDSLLVSWNVAGAGELVCIRTDRRNCFSDTVKLKVLISPPAPGSISGVEEVCDGKTYYYQPTGAAVWLDGSRQRKGLSFGKDSVLLAVTHNPCGTDTIRKQINWNELPLAAFDVITSAPEVGLPLELVYQGPGAPITSWYLEEKDTTFTAASSPVFIPQNPGKARVRLVTQNPGGCSDSSFMDISIADNRRCFIPNSFTPNEDLHNQLFRPSLTGATWMQMEIYNTWGQMVYHGEGLDAGWNGKMGDANMPEGVYLYVIILEFNGLKRKYTYEGTIHLLR